MYGPNSRNIKHQLQFKIQTFLFRTYGYNEYLVSAFNISISTDICSLNNIVRLTHLTSPSYSLTILILLSIFFMSI